MQHTNLIPTPGCILPFFIRAYYPETMRGVQDLFDDLVGVLGDGFNPDTEGAEYINAKGEPIFTTEQGILIDIIMANCRDTCNVFGADIYLTALNCINNPKK